MQPQVDDRGLVDEIGAAALLTVAPATLRVWRCTGRYGLPFLKVGRMVRYRVADIDRFLAARTRGTADRGAQTTAGAR